MADQTLASSATRNSGSRYHIFINHRGPDVKKNFASHLYNRFDLCKLRAFLDAEALQVGEQVAQQIARAIATASVHIAIFSPTYAQSPWCLEELHLMLESGAPIIPVFYNVKPAHLRCRRGRGRFAQFLRKIPWLTKRKDGMYAEALYILERKMTYDAQTGREKLRYEPSTIEKWRKDLSRVADIAGLELEQCNGDEGTLANKIVQRVKELLKEKESRKGMKMWLLRRLCNGGCSKQIKDEDVVVKNMVQWRVFEKNQGITQ